MNNSAKLMALVVTVIVVLCTISVVSDATEADEETVNLDPDDSLDSAITDTSYNSSSDVVLVLSKGTYNYTTTSSTAFHGRSLTILAAEGASVKIELDGSADGAENIAALSTATNGVETSLYVEGVTFTAPDGQAGQLRKWTFDNVTFKDCRFENTSLDTYLGGNDDSDEGTFSIVGCVFETSVGTHPSNPFAVHVMANDVLIRDTTVSGYERGINIGVHGEDTGSVMVTGCTIQNLIGTNSKHIALQVGDSIGDAIIAVTDNEISAQYGLSIHDGATIGEHAAVNVIGNTFTDCDADLFYAGETTQNYGIAINLLDNSFVHGGVSSDSPTLGNESETTVPEDDVAITDLSEEMSWYMPGAEMTISDEGQLREFAALVNSGIDFDGERVRLGGNITISGGWTPIGQGTRDGTGYTDDSTPFRGTFDGNGHSISGLEIKTTDSEDYALGLFGIVAGGTVTDLTLLDVDIDCSGSEMAGAVAGMLCEGGTVSGCTVGAKDDASKVTAGRGNGGIVGRMTLSGTIEGCTNYAEITGTSTSGNTGGIVGAAYYANDGMTISGCHNYGDVSGAMGIGGIVGLTSANISDCHNHGAVKGSGTSIGGIVGEARGGTVVVGCTNGGAVSNGSSSTGAGGYGTGGIIGWIRYIDPDNYGDNTTVSVSGSINREAVTSGSIGAGGIVGMLYHGATVDGNISTGNISGNGMVGGIVGGVQTTDAFHSGSTCHIRITGNTSSGELKNTGLNTGSIVGHLTNLDSESGCELLHGSYVTNYGNKSTATGTDIDGFQQVGTLFSTVIDGVTYGYHDLGSALANCPDGGVVTVHADAQIDERVDVARGQSITIDLNGNDITSTSPYGLVCLGTLTIVDSTATEPPTVNDDMSVSYDSGKIINTTDNGQAVIVAFGGTVILRSGTIEANNIGIYGQGDYNRSGTGSANIVIEGGYVHSKEVCVSPQGKDAVVTINGGVFLSDDNAAISGNGTVNDTTDYGGTTINITDGTIIGHITTDGYIACGIYHPQDGNLNISGGTIYAVNGVGVLVRAGTANITGGDIISTGSSQGHVGDSSVTVPSGALVLDSKSAYPGADAEFMVDISGGSFSASENVSTVNQVAPDGDDEILISIIGGTFTSDVSEYCANGYEAQERADGSYGIAVSGGDAVAENSTTGQQYASLADAIMYANDCDTIALLSDISETVTFDRDIELTLDLDEFTLSAGSGSPVTVTAGTLIIDASTGGIAGTSAAVLINNGATVDIVGGKLTSNGYTVQIRGDGSRVEIGGNTSITGPAGVAIYGGSLSMSGGSIDATVYGIAGNGTYDGTTIVISGGNIASDGNAIFHPQEGDITISGGNISGITGLWYSGAGKITISGGTIVSFDEDDRTVPWKPVEQDDGTSYDGAALSIVSRGSGYQDGGKTIEVEITGGTLESAANYAMRDYRFAKSGGAWQTNDGSGIGDSALASLSISGNARFISPAGHPVLDVDPVSSERYSIAGGSFTSDVSAYLADGYVLVSNPDGTYGIAPEGETVTVTFVIGEDEVAVTVPMGTAIPAGMIPDLPEAPEHYGYSWDKPTDSPFYEDATITARLMITDVEVSVDIDGDTAVAVIETPVEYVDAEYYWYFGIDGDDYVPIGFAETVVLEEDGRYGLAIMIMDANGVFGMATCEFDYVAESDLPPFIPFPDDDDVYVPIPPSVVVQQDSSDDDTTTIAACAAAAVAAAILAILLASLYRRK